MDHEEPTRLPVHEAETGRPISTSLSGFREIRPGHCSRCDTAIPGDAHFCPSCQCYHPVPDVGRLASPKRRLAATMLDGLFQDGGLAGSLLGPVITPSGTGIALLGIMSTAYWLFSLYLWSRGTTPAKRLLQMGVITEDGEPAGFFRMAFRETIGKWLSMAVFGLGLLAIPFDKERQGWHDKIFGTWVVLEDEP